MVIVFMFWGYSQIFISFNEQVDIEEQLEIWRKELPASYQFTVISGCMLVTESKAVVSNGKHTYALGSEKINLAELFDVAKRAKAQAYKFKIDYHDKYGFPTLIDVDWRNDVIDDECFYEVADFETIEL